MPGPAYNNRQRPQERCVIRHQRQRKRDRDRETAPHSAFCTTVGGSAKQTHACRRVCNE